MHRLTVRVQPNASADRVETWETDDAGRTYLKVRVRAVPEKGSANKALAQLMAKRIGVPKSAVSLDSGSTSRIKTLRISGRTPDGCSEIERTLAGFMKQTPD